jgi:hypothetical protein
MSRRSSLDILASALQILEALQFEVILGLSIAGGRALAPPWIAIVCGPPSIHSPTRFSLTAVGSHSPVDDLAMPLQPNWRNRDGRACSN